MKQFLLKAIMLALVLTSIAGRAEFPVDDTIISRALCPIVTCHNHWNQTSMMMCNDPLNTVQTPGKDFVFGTYLFGGAWCLCPCNFGKFYN